MSDIATTVYCGLGKWLSRWAHNSEISRFDSEARNKMPYKNKADQAAASKAHYERNLVKMKARAAVHRNAMRVAAMKLTRELRSVPCMDCGGSFPPVCMDFDHVRGVKVDNVAIMCRGSHSLKTLLAEIAKCEIVCANCHRLRTERRRCAGEATHEDLANVPQMDLV